MAKPGLTMREVGGGSGTRWCAPKKLSHTDLIIHRSRLRQEIEDEKNGVAAAATATGISSLRSS